ncbi:MAG: cupin domain-containing protein [Candidatus Zixiibacteriota bacterium]|nr:MAG: cupin domain-containing protein [candidate division Zixibacteria bacterium]
MEKSEHKNNRSVYPDFIRNLPEVDVPVKGVRGWLLESGRQQVVFFEIRPEAIVPPHSHCAQWGVMLEGEMDLTIAGDTFRVRKGDHYFIPEATEHSATFLSPVSVIDIFDAPDRYKRRK